MAMAYPLLGTRFVLDEEKILKENKYDLSKMYAKIEEMAKQCGLIKIDKNTYHCKGNEEDLARLGGFVLDFLVKSEWFTLNVKEWECLDSDEGNENMIDYFQTKNRGVWA